MQTIEQKIIDNIEETINDMGFELVIVRLKGTTSKILEILIDRLNDEKVTIEDCEEVSQNISAILDVEGIIEEAYSLEVSSSGLERPLVKFDNFIRFTGREVKIKLTELLKNKSRYKGKIIKAENNIIYLKLEEGEIAIDYNLIKSANLILTDEIFQKLLNKK